MAGGALELAVLVDERGGLTLGLAFCHAVDGEGERDALLARAALCACRARRLHVCVSSARTAAEASDAALPGAGGEGLGRSSSRGFTLRGSACVAPVDQFTSTRTEKLLPPVWCLVPLNRRLPTCGMGA